MLRHGESRKLRPDGAAMPASGSSTASNETQDSSKLRKDLESKFALLNYLERLGNCELGRVIRECIEHPKVY